MTVILIVAHSHNGYQWMTHARHYGGKMADARKDISTVHCLTTYQGGKMHHNVTVMTPRLVLLSFVALTVLSSWVTYALNLNKNGNRNIGIKNDLNKDHKSIIQQRTRKDTHIASGVGCNIPLVSRRNLFESGASATKTALIVAASTALGTAGTPTPAYGKDAGTPTSYERIIPQTELLSQLSTAPVRNVIITGANSGVGLAGAKLLTAAGHHVTLACRTKAKGDSAAAKCTEYATLSAKDDSFFPYRRGGGTATGAECDLSSLASIRSFASSVKDTSVDTLVLNAGLAHGQSDTQIYRTAEGFEETVGVNHLGHFYLAKLLAPTLEKRGGARLVSTASPVHDPTSGGGDVGSPATLGNLSGLSSNAPQFSMVDGGPYDPDKAYKDSKLCNVLFMAEAARRYDGKFTVNAFSPGLIADPNGFFRSQNKAFATVFNGITKAVGVAESNEFGGSALAYMAVDPSMGGLTGGWYDSVPPGKHQLAKHLPSAEAQNRDEQKLLWDLSSKLVGL